MLTNSDIAELTELRRTLHRQPELSGEEVETAKTIVEALTPLAPSKILTGLGGHGVAAVFDSGEPGPTVLFRAELDALPIQEISDNPWKSEVDGKGHLCGHDGHMMFLMGLGRILSRSPVEGGRVVLMFQPAEEDGSGARAVVADPAFDEIRPDWAFAIHIEPGRPWAYVSTRTGLVNCASQGVRIKLTGKTAHAADPEDGVSPAMAVARLIPALDALGSGGKLDDDFRLVTITHCQVGEPTFGTAPGEGEIYATLRTARDEAMESIATDARQLATDAANEFGLDVTFDIFDDFAASINDGEATDLAIGAMDKLGIENGDFGLPMRASEDFGVFGWGAKAAMLCMGPGNDYAALHNPDYDFPDDLIPVGVSIFEQITRDILGTKS
ncbi:amidohydrolase [Phaeobacter gallaeciensis]|uniref:Amidohydrolase n=1 Tax=Phaeobacter gallaeciensis TaxID=60890 RepID=A0AAC9Z7T9_9RHOB|nr:amidohydrolase [Phaeobacter gallaeciensis]AHD08864.1 amidohydrolase [Phaeobacter gallaeciensis DSM 26640]ATE92130.1 amidohydrolase [Phaeobacter gallaeciensis]ATE98051.1 amidohydrolase [Phaeobacter gallaeciensis]ATF00741.1 amidohydrolase [Phaeobacter gallaeciensis]ATF05172.1 amidohydrolase [Phaeobacter gallaeciensis]